MADVKWIKVSTDMFESNRKIKQIEMMPEGDTILVIWLKLLLLAGNVNDGGAIYLTPEIPYTEEMLATELRRPLNTVKMALTIFEKFGMIEIIDDILHLSAWEKHQSVDKLAEIRERNRLAQQKSRENRRRLQAPKDDVNDISHDSHMTCHDCHALEEEGDKDQEKESHSFIHSSREEAKMRYLGGSLGKGVVMLSDEQMDSLLEELSVEEFDKYVGIVADMELSGKHYKKKTHYQAILDMAAKDRRTKA
jgi:predicted phage replisome organizer